MLDRGYFEAELPSQIEAAGRPLTVTLVLHGGQSFAYADSVRSATDTLCLASTRPSFKE